MHMNILGGFSLWVGVFFSDQNLGAVYDFSAEKNPEQQAIQFLPSRHPELKVS